MNNLLDTNADPVTFFVIAVECELAFHLKRSKNVDFQEKGIF